MARKGRVKDSGSIPNQEWFKIPNYSQYLVTKRGIFKNIHSDHFVNSSLSKWGYSTIVLTRDDGKRMTLRVHRVLASMFIPNPENKVSVDHIDGNKINNCLSNLRWVTPKENTANSLRLGLMVKGENHPNSLLNEDSVRYIRREFRKIGKRKTNSPLLAKMFGVSIYTIHGIIKGRVWNHVA